MLCLRTKCKDYLTDGGEPHWCYKVGCPANVAMAKCPKAAAKNGSTNKVVGITHKKEEGLKNE